MESADDVSNHIRMAAVNPLYCKVNSILTTESWLCTIKQQGFLFLQVKANKLISKKPQGANSFDTIYQMMSSLDLNPVLYFKVMSLKSPPPKNPILLIQIHL